MGRPSKLSPERHAGLVGHAASGRSRAVAARLTYLGERTYDRYLARGREADETVAAELRALPADWRTKIEVLPDEQAAPPGPGEPTDPDLVTIDDAGARHWTARALALGYADSPHMHACLIYCLPGLEHPYWRLWRDIERAEASDEALDMQSITEAGRGYPVVETVTVTNYGDDGKTIKSVVVTTRERKERSWQALAWKWERRKPDVYGRRFRPEAAPSENLGGDLDSLGDEKDAAQAGLDELEQLRNTKAAGGQP